jgi:hypothetical protein
MLPSKGELSIKAKVDQGQKGDYFVLVSASDPQGNKSLIWILVGATSFRSVTVTVMVLAIWVSPVLLAIIPFLT